MFCSVCVLLGSHFSGKIYLFSPNLISTGTAVCDVFLKVIKCPTNDAYLYLVKRL